jgi:Tfp pilus assembly protein PilO
MRSLFGLKGDTKKESADKYINRLDSQARFHIVEVSTNLNLLKAEIEQFRATVDKINAQLPGQQEKKI